ncbi:cystatin-like [Erythrolamprus reginae]|uniref:cystatin-like n=1 Tax=Erythrolamprus reginae TaxID=121349 RepID=UPI00396C6137
MVHPRLPIPGLLGLFGALLVVSPEVAMWTPEGWTETCSIDPGVGKALDAAMDQYNKDNGTSPNYSKPRILEAWFKEDTEGTYHLKVKMMKTTCKKEAGQMMSHKQIQKCEQFPGNPENETVSFSPNSHRLRF